MSGRLETTCRSERPLGSLPGCSGSRVGKTYRVPNYFALQGASARGLRKGLFLRDSDIYKIVGIPGGSIWAPWWRLRPPPKEAGGWQKRIAGRTATINRRESCVLQTGMPLISHVQAVFTY